MKYLKITTKTPELVPEKYKDALTNRGLEISDLTLLFELMLVFFDYEKLEVVDENGKKIESVS